MSETVSKTPPDAFLNIVTDQWSAPFWQAAAEHRLVAPRCGKCARFRMPPSPFCPECHSQDILWVELSGKGTVYSYTVVWRAISPEMHDSVPYVPAVIALLDADGVRLISNIVGAPIDAIRIDAAVQVVWREGPTGHTVPQFRLLS